MPTCGITKTRSVKSRLTNIFRDDDEKEKAFFSHDNETFNITSEKSSPSETQKRGKTMRKKLLIVFDIYAFFASLRTM